MSRAKRKGNPNGRGKAKPVTVSVMPSSWDKGATGAANRMRLVEEPATDFDPDTGRETANPNGIRRHRRESWARIYHRQGKLTDAQLASAEKLRLAAEGMRERDPLAAIGETRAKGGDPSVARFDARRHFRDLWDAVPTSSRPAVERVAINDEPIWHGNTVQRERHIQRLCVGLDAIR